ncbi:MAG: T9SS type A sorting domain-containing protein [Lewinellaceae bacterium]|nr:T9SS type A sorting domain-containing protein [Lewinellaceae bacterium]
MNSLFTTIRSIVALVILSYPTMFFGQEQCYTCNNPREGLVACYPFEGNANDESGNNWHGIIFGNPLFLDGVRGKAIYLDGTNDYVRISDNFQLPDTFTITAWIKTENIGREWQTLFTKRGSNGYSFWSGLHKDKSNYKSNFWVTNQDNIDSNSNIFDNEWHHVCWVGFQNGQEMEIQVYIDYLEGFPDNIGVISSISQHTGIVTIGAEVPLQNDNFEGYIDDLRIYDRALSEEEISCIVPTDDIYLGNNKIKLSPNPNPGVFTLQFEEETTAPLSANIYNALGERVNYQALEKGTSLLNFDLSKQMNGMYFLSIQDETGTYLKALKFLIQ